MRHGRSWVSAAACLYMGGSLGVRAAGQNGLGGGRAQGQRGAVGDLDSVYWGGIPSGHEMEQEVREEGSILTHSFVSTVTEPWKRRTTWGRQKA